MFQRIQCRWLGWPWDNDAVNVWKTCIARRMRQYIQREKYISREKIGRERADKTDWYLITSKNLIQTDLAKIWQIRWCGLSLIQAEKVVYSMHFEHYRTKKWSFRLLDLLLYIMTGISCHAFNLHWYCNTEKLKYSF